MPTEQKIKTVAEIKERVSGSSISIITQFVGMNVEQATTLRKQLREAGAQLKVYKNNLAKIALDDLGLSSAAEFMEGPTAWAFCDDPVAPAKVLKDFSKEVQFIVMRGGVLSGAVVNAQQMEALAALPSREVLLAQVVGTIAAPLRDTVGVLSALPRNLVNALDQIRQQKEETPAA
ncbi:MAG: 50S ribosomal protein L10 [Candidatus Hydrogenedens sp.]|nr:50S ribosomal protein L10 [Candidatus Hydrogenedens sp.]